MAKNDLLFHKVDIHCVLVGQEKKLEAEIQEVEPGRLLNRNPEEWCDFFVARFSMDVPELLDAEVTADQEESEVDVPEWNQDYHVEDQDRPCYVKGTRVTYYVPFGGERDFFSVKPSTFTFNPPRAIIREAEVLFIYDKTGHDPGAIRAEYRRDLLTVKQWLDWLRQDVKGFNESLPARVKAKVEARREKLLKDQVLAAALGIPLRRREDDPKTYAVPTVRRKPRVPPAHSRKGGAVSEPTLSMEQYERILSVIQNMVLVMERSPHAFKGMKEEDIRQHFLVQLNGQYEGQATGETFNFEGKTDILVRVEGKNVFIAECKFWDGPKAFADTIGQLTRYVSWRDTKTAILLFNRTKGLSSVLEKVPEVVRAYPTFKREEGRPSETAFRFRLGHRDDPDREIVLTVLLFELPADR